MTKENLTVAVVQMTSATDYKKNLEQIESILDGIKEDYDVVFLPECFYSLSDGTKPSPYLVNFENEHYQRIKDLVIKYKKYFIGGSVAFDGGEGKVLNRMLNFSPDGELINFYDKVNLFNCDFKKGKSINEADIYTAGEKPQIVEVKGFKIGCAICFDLRFPNFLLNYYKENVDLITFSAAFTVPTGKAHWHTLLRARSVEGQCFTVASAQVGKNNERIKTYGHSLVVGPWGEVLSDQKEDVGVSILTLSKEEVSKVRERISISYL